MEKRRQRREGRTTQTERTFPGRLGGNNDVHWLNYVESDTDWLTMMLLLLVVVAVVPSVRLSVVQSSEANRNTSLTITVNRAWTKRQLGKGCVPASGSFAISGVTTGWASSSSHNTISLCSDCSEVN